MLDWVAIDKNAERDLVDGLRDLRVQKASKLLYPVLKTKDI
jgi:hypothetical protein